MLGVAAEIMAEINKAGFTRPSPIQVSDLYSVPLCCLWNNFVLLQCNILHFTAKFKNCYNHMYHGHDLQKQLIFKCTEVNERCIQCTWLCLTCTGL